jgi:Peptidase family M50
VPFGGFGLLSVFYVFMGVRFLVQFLPRRREIFDDNFTPYDRSMVGRAAFFLLLPISVALHELGHAIAIWLFGGKVLEVQYLFFAGSVSYDPTDFTPTQQTVVAFAGTLVNMLLILLAVGMVFLKRPPLRHAWNDLLIQFVYISGINALILYPLLDLMLNIDGDWSQIYRSGVSWLIAVIVALQVGFVAAGYWAWRTPSMRMRLAELTGYSGLSLRLSSDQSQPAAQAGARDPELRRAEQTAANAAARVSSGWNAPAMPRIDRSPNASVVSLQWESNDTARAIGVVLRRGGAVELVGMVAPPGAPEQNRVVQTIRRWPEIPSEYDLTIAIRMAMEQVESWTEAVRSGVT